MGLKDIGELSSDSHSNSVVWDKDGKILDRANNMPCYSHLWSGIKGAEKLCVFFPKHPDEDTHVRELVEWILNHPTFGGVFKTKEYDEGMENGFEVDLHQPTNYIFMCLAALRMPWEAGNSFRYCWEYNTYKDLGFSVEEAFYLAVMRDVILHNSGSVDFERCNYNNNHIPFPTYTSFRNYLLGNFKKQEGTMYENSSYAGVSGSWSVGDNKTERSLYTRYNTTEDMVKAFKEFFDSVRTKIEQEEAA